MRGIEIMDCRFYVIQWKQGEELWRVLLCEDGTWMISDRLYEEKDSAITNAISECSWSFLRRDVSGWHIYGDWFTWIGDNTDAISMCIASHELEVSLLSDNKG